jgi:hypothetical protein
MFSSSCMKMSLSLSLTFPANHKFAALAFTLSRSQGSREGEKVGTIWIFRLGYGKSHGKYENPDVD